MDKRINGDFNTSVCGIPCQVLVESYIPGHRGTRDRFAQGMLAEPGLPPEDPEIEFVLLDRKGYRARWLERKMDPEDEIALVAEIERERERFIRQQEEY